MTTPPRFDPVIHAPNRLRVCAMLAASEGVEFSTLRDALGVSDSVLSKNIKILEDDGYVKVTKAVSASRVRTWLSFTSFGRKRYEGHVNELRRLVALKPGD